jgi:hypothetical protein
MKLNLRKSSALQLAISEQIASTEMPLSVSIGRYDNPVKERDSAVAKFKDGYNKKRALIAVLYSIRRKTATASEAAGVSNLLAEIACIDKIVGMLDSISRISVFAKTDAQLDAAITDLRNEASIPVQYAHQRRESFEESVISEDQVKVWKDEIAAKKREKQGFSDSLLDANVKNEIEVSEQEEAILKKYGIL